LSDPHNSAAESILQAVLNAKLDARDIALCEALEKLAEGTGQNKFRHAASVLRGTKLGRNAIDDHAALRAIAAFPPAQRHKAVGDVAGKVAGAGASDKRVKTIERRLRRKREKEITDKKVLSVAAVP
jgi:hypothetical protein